jgi:hypothetical protein
MPQSWLVPHPPLGYNARNPARRERGNWDLSFDGNGSNVDYRIEQDDCLNRAPAASYTYRIYNGDRLIARYLHDFRGDEHRIDFLDGTSEDWPVGRMVDFIEGSGPEPLRLTDRAMAYLRDRQS